ncbi:fascin domain-containing protein [Parafrankia sp. FMc2]|uniref:fascin domain-containing protein n=1 Tax=Parafrankia sp. FMc2 TaxID=3233196 RepID=UPI0034D452B1
MSTARGVILAAVMTVLLVVATTVSGAPPASAGDCGPGSAYYNIYSPSANRYVAVELGGNYKNTSKYRMLRTRTAEADLGPWEIFFLCLDSANGDVSLYSPSSGYWVSVELGGDYSGANRFAVLRARAGERGPWERFRISCSVPLCSLYSPAADKWVSAELGGQWSSTEKGMLRARNADIGPWEQFQLVQRRI